MSITNMVIIIIMLRFYIWGGIATAGDAIIIPTEQNIAMVSIFLTHTYMAGPTGTITSTKTCVHTSSRTPR